MGANTLGKASDSILLANDSAYISWPLLTQPRHNVGNVEWVRPTDVHMVGHFGLVPLR
jgi:hypothetical protein